MGLTTGENEKQLLAATVRERLIGKKNFILYKDLLNEKIPTFLKNYLQNSVRKIIHTEEPIQFKNSSRFNFEYGKITELKNSLMKAFEEATIFPREELIEIINKTVSLQFNLLLKPKTTLLKIFFKSRSERTRSDIIQILEGLDDNRIFIKTLIKKIRDFDQFHIVEDDFKKVLQQTEQEVYNDNLLTAFISDVNILTDFLSMIRGYENDKINIGLIKLLLSERNLSSLSSTLGSFKEEIININEISSVFTKLLEEKKKEEQKLEEDEIDNFIMYSVSKEEDGGNGKIKSSSNLIEKPHIETEEIPKQPTTESTKVVKKKPNGIKKINNVYKDPYDMVIERSKIEEQPDIPLDPLKRLIDEKSEKFLAKRIFDNNKNEYEIFVEQLNSIDNWKKAKEVIDKELFVRSIKPFSKEALRLGDLVFNRYFPKKYV